MKYQSAVEKLRTLAEACERAKIFWIDTEPLLKAVVSRRQNAPASNSISSHARL